MNAKTLVKWSNRIGIIAIITLIYWVFTFIVIQVFGFRIFAENLSEIFILSVVGILAVMAGSLMLNIMLNLTQIAQGRQNDGTPIKNYKPLIIGLIALFPLITAILFAGDYANTQKKRDFMTNATIQITQISGQKIQNFQKNLLANLTITDIDKLSKELQMLNHTSPAIGWVSLIVADTVDNEPVFLQFHADSYGYVPNDDKKSDTLVNKSQFISYFEKEKSDYLMDVFAKKTKKIYFSSHDGKFELLYPYIVNGEVIAVYKVNDYMRYGKYGS